MRNRAGVRAILISMIASAAMSAAPEGRNHPYRLDLPSARIAVEFYTSAIARVRVTPHGFSRRKSLAVIATPLPVKVRVRNLNAAVRLETDELVLIVRKSDGAITFSRPGQPAFLTATGVDSSSFERIDDLGEEACAAVQGFALSPDEGVYGLGQFEDGVVNFRGHEVLLAQANRTAVNPFLVSTRGYGILWDNASRSKFIDRASGTFFSSEVADEIDYYVCSGPTMDQAIAQNRLLTGPAPLPPKWALGFWQSKERYTSAAEMLDVVREYRRRGIPVDNFVQDWNYWPSPGQFSGMVWDRSRFPDPKGFVDSVHANDGHLMISIWPAFGRESDLYREMDSLEYLYPRAHWNNGKVYDAFNPGARDLYWKHIKRGLFDIGIDAFWMDATEPEFRCTDDRYITELSMKENGRHALGSFARYLNAYSLVTTEGFARHQRATTEVKRVMILTRSSFAGQQRTGAATWSGDTFASWDNLRVQIAGGMNFSMSGLPYWNSDIGGFITGFHFPAGLSDPAYRELYVRWFQFGAFSPIFRAHGTDIPREIWRFGEPGDWAYDALVTADRLRYRLLPYLYSTAWQVTSSGGSIIRGLPMGYPGDRKTYDIATQFFVGSSIMVCPVTGPMFHAPEFPGIDITPDHFFSPTGNEPAAVLKIYRGLNFDQMVIQRPIDVGQIAWFGCIPASLDTCYSLTIEGQLRADVDGEHTFYVVTDGGVRLWIDSTLIIDRWDNSTRQTFSSPAGLKASCRSTFRAEHRQFRPGTATFKMNWRKPGVVMLERNVISVYLPGGSGWYDFWTGEKHAGGETIRASAPIARIPLFVPAGSIIPLGGVVQYALEKNGAPTELRIYPGKDADFVLYEDEGDSYRYERGIYQTIRMHWDDARKLLRIGDRTGTYPGAEETRVFRVTLVDTTRGIGAGPTEHPQRIVTYAGKRTTVSLSE